MTVTLQEVLVQVPIIRVQPTIIKTHGRQTQTKIRIQMMATKIRLQVILPPQITQ